MTRKESNEELLNILKLFIIEHPELRFIQALWALGIVSLEDRFYEESDKTLDKVKEVCYNCRYQIDKKKGN